MSRNASFSPVTLPIPLRADRASGFSWKEPSSWGEKTQISWLKVKTMINFLFCSLRLSLRPVKSYYVLRLSPVVYFLFVWDFSLNLWYLIETFPIKVILLWSWRQECGFWRFCQWSPAWLGLPQSCKCQTPAWPSPCPVAMATYNLKSKISLFLKDIIWQHKEMFS